MAVRTALDATARIIPRHDFTIDLQLSESGSSAVAERESPGHAAADDQNFPEGSFTIDL